MSHGLTWEGGGGLRSNSGVKLAEVVLPLLASHGVICPLAGCMPTHDERCRLTMTDADSCRLMLTDAD
jgi:hypothetical protein